MEKLSELGDPLPQPAGPESGSDSAPFRISHYRIDPDLNRIAGPTGESHVEPKAMAVLVHLARWQGKVVSADELVKVIWLGRPMGDNPVYRCIAQLRRAFGDDAQSPSYIVTVPKKGYRLIPPVEKLAPDISPSSPAKSAETAPALAGWRGNAFHLAMLAGLAALAALAVLPWVGRDEVASPPGTGSATLAVLPFANLSPDPEHEQFADGISEEILNRLSAYAELQVIARTSSFVFKDSGYDVRRICDLLGVEYLLQGSVRRDNGDLRISATLVDRNGFQLWQTTLERELGGIFALQDEIAAAVATSIVPQIVPHTASVRLPDLEAYEAYLTGREILARRERRSGPRATVHLDRAIELDPEFAEAYAERAVALVLSDFVDAGDTLDRAQLDLERALALKPDLARGHAVLALLLAARDPYGNVAAREAALRRSLALDPNQVDAWNWLYPVLDAQGRPAEAEQALLRAVRLDPLAPSPNANLAAREFARGDSAAAERRLERLMAVPGAPASAPLGFGTHYFATGQFVKRLEVAKRSTLASIASDGEPPELLPLIGTYAALGLPDRARYWSDRSREVHPNQAWMRPAEIFLLSDLGMDDAAESYHRLTALIEAGEVDFDSLGGLVAAVYGSLAALAGDDETAIRILEPLFARDVLDFPASRRARHALAWTYLRRGERTRAVELLEPIAPPDQTNQVVNSIGVIDLPSGYLSGTRAGDALTRLLLDDQEAALDLLEQAVERGWRGYYVLQRDPRWATLHDEPRFQAVLARIKADIDAQRSQVETIDAEDDFIARFDAALSATQQRR
jgi:TolB-like protein/DNA-binding winged helix-turn-helix (wHTH) protein/tetratricopeptide (TPR) repeat protein